MHLQLILWLLMALKHLYIHYLCTLFLSVFFFLLKQLETELRNMLTVNQNSHVAGSESETKQYVKTLERAEEKQQKHLCY